MSATPMVTYELSLCNFNIIFVDDMNIQYINLSIYNIIYNAVYNINCMSSQAVTRTGRCSYMNIEIFVYIPTYIQHHTSFCVYYTLRIILYTVFLFYICYVQHGVHILICVYITFFILLSYISFFMYTIIVSTVYIILDPLLFKQQGTFKIVEYS